MRDAGGGMRDEGCSRSRGPVSPPHTDTPRALGLRSAPGGTVENIPQDSEVFSAFRQAGSPALLFQCSLGPDLIQPEAEEYLKTGALHSVLPDFDSQLQTAPSNESSAPLPTAITPLSPSTCKSQTYQSTVFYSIGYRVLPSFLPNFIIQAYYTFGFS